jgi:hypothetical protein
VVTGNTATSGNGGQGGDGGGTGGNSADSSGGGIYDGFAGTLKMLQDTITANQILDGRGGAAGSGPKGHRGQDSEGSGGGITIARNATARAADTDIFGNSADHHSDQDGHIGTI